jgi:hypothetical protein
MNAHPAQLTLDQWHSRYGQLRENGLTERFYGGPLQRHFDAGDKRLARLRFDNAPAALALWNLILTEEDRLRLWRHKGNKIVGTMKDLGTTPLLAYAFDNLAAFYPDAAWWIPCFKQNRDGLFDLADQHGLDAAFCPVRAMVGAFVNGQHFPIPDALICAVGAVCDDFSIAAQRLESLGRSILWWEVPRRRTPDPGEPATPLTDGLSAPDAQVRLVRQELVRIGDYLEQVSGQPLSIARLAETLRKANRIRRLLRTLRQRIFTAPRCPLGALETMLAEMLAIHFCSDPDETELILTALLDEVNRRIAAGLGVLPENAVRMYWINPPADIYAMNLLEACGGRLCGTDFMFPHALAPLDETADPFTALAKAALTDPMIGSSRQRADGIARDIAALDAEAVVLCRIPGASHCAAETRIIADLLRDRLNRPVLDIEIPSLIDPCETSLTTRLEALTETARSRRTL